MPPPVSDQLPSELAQAPLQVSPFHRKYTDECSAATPESSYDMASDYRLAWTFRYATRIVRRSVSYATAAAKVAKRSPGRGTASRRPIMRWLG